MSVTETNRSEVIEAIVRAVEDQERGRLTVVERRPILGSDGQQYGLGLPCGVHMVGTGEPYYVFAMRDGTTVGKRYETRGAADSALAAIIATKGVNMRAACADMPIDRLQSQADYWLPKPVLTKRLHNGREVLAESDGDDVRAITYANRAQAEARAATLGPNWAVYQFGRPFYVGFSTPADMLEDTESDSLPPGKTTMLRECPSGSGITVRLNHQKNGVEIVFSSKPDAGTLANLKAHGWRWAKFTRCWYKQQSQAAIDFANKLAGTNLHLSGSAAPRGEDWPCSDQGYEDQCAAACGLS